MNIVVGDVGGTNNLLGVFDTEKNKITDIRKENTGDIESFPKLINDYIQEFESEKNSISGICVAGAGPLKKGKIELSHVDISINAEELREVSGLDQVLVINDFSALSRSTQLIDKKDFQQINSGSRSGKKAFVGAGTGLGKSLLVENKVISSEGGQADIVIRNQKELELIEYIKDQKGLDRPIEYEDVVSGRGLEAVYDFLQRKKYKDSPSKLTAPEISDRKDSDQCCRETFNLFIRFYGRCCKNYVLDVLADELYIAGGIALKNSEEFNGLFLEEFFDVNQELKDTIKDMPVKIIKDPHAGLKGAAKSFMEEFK